MLDLNRVSTHDTDALPVLNQVASVVTARVITAVSVAAGLHDTIIVQPLAYYPFGISGHPAAPWDDGKRYCILCEYWIDLSRTFVLLACTVVLVLVGLSNFLVILMLSVCVRHSMPSWEYALNVLLSLFTLQAYC